MAHIGVGKYCGEVLRASPLENVDTLCRPPAIYVSPDVDHVSACNEHWLYTICHEIVGGCAYCTKLSCLTCQPYIGY